ncbi:AAA family ATPase [Streptomyces sp. NPDC048172]|uniref:AAA family ATPase n=1 Tax=Streptomyces sp. NPDC048172 TaxID=3365505 RepID=UPI0037155687
MRLHQLTLTAFGPFGGTHQVDFDALSSAGLFLLHGATGAGKTSVLDAVCYALYGGVPGARQQPGGTLRSDHAEPRTLTSVTLELTVAGRRLEISRSPEQLRPKARGTGLTRERAHSELREYDPGTGEWKGLSRSHQEIGEEIGQLLGMSRDQFCQVVLLPQGEFARFLRSGAEERAKLLGRLFDTGRFAAVEDELARMRKEAQRDVAAGDEQLLALAHRMRQAAGADPELGEGPGSVPGLAPASPSRASASAAPSDSVPAPRASGTRPRQRSADTALAPGDPGLADAVLEWAALARTGARERLGIAAVAAEDAEHRHSTAAHALDEARELARRQHRYAEARRRADELAARGEEREAARHRLERARAAEAVAPALALRDSARDEHRAAASAEQRSRAELPPELARAEPARLTEVEGGMRQELGSLAAARDAERRRAALDTELAALDSESSADDGLLREAAEWLDGWETERAAHQTRIDAAQDAATRAERLAGQLRPARDRLEAARRRDRLAGELAGAERRLLDAREAATGAHEKWLALKEARLRGIAAELAAHLADGEPCAVCGSTAHPDPARPGAGHVDRAAEDAAFAASQDAGTARETAERALAALREGHTAAEADSGGDPADRLASDLAALESEHRTAHAEAARAHEAREALAAAEREHDERLAQRQDAERRAAARTSTRETLQRERAALTEQLDQARGEAESVAARAALLERRVALLAAAAEDARTARSAAQRLEEAGERLADAARRAGFGTPEEAADAVLPEPEQRALRDRLDRWQAEETALAAELDDPELTAAAALPPAAVEACETRAEEAARRLRAASSAYDAARTRCADLEALGRSATAEARRLAPLRGGYERVARLAGLAAGTSAENERRMRLESYVLAARLEQVADAASARLARMSGGRYTLVHSDERASGRGRSGLGLHVVDAWTGAERDTATLSGGETFFASLALALGLADVVTEEAGGTRLDTLFIDEGFGSLDEQTLDEVLDVLDGLRERDRCVGIVSHVADLRQRIPAQLEVSKSRTGSAVRLRAAVPAS